MGEVAISLVGVGKEFTRRGGSVEAVRDVHLQVGDGEFVAIIGPSGCGKSTLLRIIAGLLEPTTGTIRVGEQSPAEARRAKWFGLVPQTPALMPWRTVRANIGLLTEVNRAAGNRRRDQHRRARRPVRDRLDRLDRHEENGGLDVDALIDAIGLRPFERALPGELSGGMQQRVAIARAFAVGAPVLLMDEPFASLDELTREDMRFLLLHVWGSAAGLRRRTVVFVTHNLEEAVLLADRVVVLSSRPGTVVSEVPIDLPRPRTAELEDSAEYLDHTRRVRAALREGRLR